MKDNPLVDQSLQFALDILDFCKGTVQTPLNTNIISQILRCSTSVSANIAEANASCSKRDFKHKLSIALKEAKESEFWILLMKQSSFMDVKTYTRLNNECQSIIKMLYKSIKTVSKSIK